jgi:colicin import membrane protein
MTAAAATMFDERVDPGKALSFLLAAAMHVLLFLVLVFGVRWQSSPPEAVQVELWNPPAEAPPVEEPKPVPKVEPTPPPVVQPEVAKPEPVVPKPEIVEKKAPVVKSVQKPPPPKPAVKVAPPPVAKAVPTPVPPRVPARPRDEEAQRQIREQLQREQNSFAVDRERQHVKDQLARESDAARLRGLADYEAKIRNKVRGNIVLSQDIQGNPEAHFLVVQLPTGEVLSSRLVKSSGYRAYDEAVERAILKSSPLPRPDRPELFSRELKLTFRPKD